MAEEFNSILSDVSDVAQDCLEIGKYQSNERIENSCDKNLGQIVTAPFVNCMVKKDYDSLSVSTYTSSSCVDSQDDMSDLGNNVDVVKSIPTAPTLSGSIGPVSVESSSDILFGSKTLFNGPVVIKRFVVDNDNPTPSLTSPTVHAENNLSNVSKISK